MTLLERIAQTFGPEAAPKFSEIFGINFTYILHRYGNAEKKYFFWSDGEKKEYEGLTDARTSVFIRFRDENSSGTVNKQGTYILYKLRLVGTVINSKNTAQIANFIAYQLHQGGFEVFDINLNAQFVYENEAGTGHLKHKAADFFSIDFDGLEPILNNCAEAGLTVINC